MEILNLGIQDSYLLSLFLNNLCLQPRFTAEERAKRPQLCHIPFGFGPRSCIGMRFALLVTKIALMEALKKYTFVRAVDTEASVGCNYCKHSATGYYSWMPYYFMFYIQVPLETVLGVTMAPKNGIYLRVISRS